MLPPAAIEAMDHLKSTVIGYAVMVIVIVAGATALSIALGGKSKANREIIFSLASLAGLFAAIYFVILKK